MVNASLLASAFAEHFGQPPACLAAAPGRLEFIGNHCDYNGGAVMGVAIDRQVGIAMAARPDSAIGLFSSSTGQSAHSDLARITALSGADSWANYALGVLHCLMEEGMNVPHGFNLAVTSTLPAGAGMSSSAAFELATATALTTLYNYPLPRKRLAQICRQAENTFVGMPCGILDQGVSAFGKRNGIVKIDCLSETFSLLPLPAGVHFEVFNTNKKHALVDSAYSTRVQECNRARDALKAQDASLPCLAHASLAQLEAIRGALTDTAFRRARHVISEHQRVLACEQALAKGDLSAVGQLLTASHESSRHDFENSCPELDFLVEQLCQQPGILGCRLTGGGFGGAVMALATETFASPHAGAVTQAYADAFGNEPTRICVETGDGAELLCEA